MTASLDVAVLNTKPLSHTHTHIFSHVHAHKRENSWFPSIVHCEKDPFSLSRQSVKKTAWVPSSKHHGNSPVSPGLFLNLNSLFHTTSYPLVILTLLLSLSLHHSFFAFSPFLLTMKLDKSYTKIVMLTMTTKKMTSLCDICHFVDDKKKPSLWQKSTEAKKKNTSSLKGITSKLLIEGFKPNSFLFVLPFKTQIWCLSSFCCNRNWVWRLSALLFQKGYIFDLRRR